MSTCFRFEAIGTRWQIDIEDALPPQKETELLAKIHERITSFDVAYSRFRNDSLVTQMSQRAGTYRLPPDAEPMIRLYDNLYRLTNGAMTPLIGQVLVEAGYDARYSLQPGILHAPPTWEDAISYDPPNLTLRIPALLDFGAAGKGYLIDLIGEIIQTQGLHTYSIDAGGDILHRHPNGNTLNVGLENPMNLEQAIGVAHIANQSICGSAGNRRAWGDFTHLIHPKTLSSPKNIFATWAIAKTTLLADGLATGLFFVNPEHLLKAYSFEYAILYSDFSIHRSPTFPGELFYSS